MIDSDGRTWRTRDGRPATAGDHFEAMTGIRRRTEGLFEQGPRTKDNPGRPDTVSIERVRSVPASTARAVKALARQAHLETSTDRQAQRQAVRAEHDRRRDGLQRRTGGPRHHDYAWPQLERQRAQAQAQARRQPRPVSLSNAMDGYGSEDLYGPLNGSLGAITLSG